MKVQLRKRILAAGLTVMMSGSVLAMDAMPVFAEEQANSVLAEEVNLDGAPEQSAVSEEKVTPSEEVPQILDGWVKKEEGWYYYKNGVMLTGWQVVNGTWYYMEENGLMASDTWIGEYYVDASGAWITHYRPAQWMNTGGRWWYRNVDGSYPARTWKLIEEEWYYFDAAGYMVTGWQNIGGAWYYLDGSGAMATGWQIIGGAWYYLNESGAMATGWLWDGTAWYYLNGSGAMVTGWLKDGANWYYLEPNGMMVIGRKTIGGQVYSFKDNGMMVTGWAQEEDGWRYYDPSGAMKKGWVQVGKTWYYCDPATGAMYESQWIENKYYVQADGSMAVGWFQAGGQWYYSDANGVKQTSKWIGGEYYVQADGTMAVDKWIGGYYVGSDGKWVPLSGNEKVYEVELVNGKKTTVIGYFDTQMADDIFKQLNEYRVQKGLEVLQPANFALQAAVNTRGYEIAYNFEHTRPNGMDCFSVYDRAIAENIAAGSSYMTAKDFMAGWKASAGHNLNMLSPNANAVGISVFKLKVGNTYQTYCVQLFAL